MCFGDDCGGGEGVKGRRSFIAGAAATVAGLAVAHGQGTAGQQQTAQPQPSPRPQQQPSPPGGRPETRVLDDPRVVHGRVTFRHNGAESGVGGFLARPAAEGVYPAVLVIAGNKITEEYIPNTCAALALAGFVGLAPNIFHPLPDDTPNDNELYRKYIGNHTDLDMLDDVQAGASHLRAQAFVHPGGMGVVGFCMGGRLAMLFGARSREIDAVVPYHPAPLRGGEAARLRAPVQIHHGTADHAVAHSESEKTLRALRAQGTPAELYLYDGAAHGFLAYTRPYYRPDHAKLSWARTTEFLQKHLGRPPKP